MRRLDDVARAQLEAPVDAICVNSAETLGNLWNNLSPAGRRTACTQALVVPAARVAEAAAALGFQHIVSAAGAGTEATLAALATLGTQRTTPTRTEP